MASQGVSRGDLVPLSERLRTLRLYRLFAVALLAIAWLAYPPSRGASAPVLAIVTAGYLCASITIETIWRACRPPTSFLLGALILLDGVFLAWASYGTGGLASPVGYLVLLQLTSVALIASWRTAVKLAIWSSLLLLCAYYAQRTGVLGQLGNPHVNFGGGYRDVVIRSSVFMLVAFVTSTFAAVNERELRRRRYDLEALAALALHLEVADDPTAVGSILLGDVADAFEYERGVVVEVRQGRLVALASHGLPSGDSLSWEEVDAPVIVTEAIEEGRTVRIARSEVRRDAVLAACIGDCHAIVVPLHADRALGALIVAHPLRHGSRVERRVVSMLERFCSHAALTLETVTLLKQIREQATLDALTGVANRRALDDELARACAYAQREQLELSIALLDVDHFKQLNDTHGHQVGDRVLRLIGTVLSQQTRASDVPARYGGEEFLIMMPGSDVEAAGVMMRRLSAAITRSSKELAVTISAGLAAFGRHGDTPEALIASADRALYAAKRAGRNRVLSADAGRDPVVASANGAAEMAEILGEHP
jgi:diguanylate cyclase (GGDEF)-like protein